jgi:glutamate synthase domain-containing protein 2
VILRVDGGFKSGVDVLMAAAMGADEYGFGSVAMIATGWPAFVTLIIALLVLLVRYQWKYICDLHFVYPFSALFFQI